MATSGGWLRTVWWVSLIVALTLAIVAGAAWANHVRSPQYSVGQLARAAADKDWDGVQKYVDVKSVVSQLVDKTETGITGGEDSWFGAGVAKAADYAKPGLTELAEAALRTSIEMGPDRPDAAVNLAGLLATMSVKSVSREGDQALVHVDAPFGDKQTIDFTLRMKRIGNYWQVIAVEDLPSLGTGQGD